MSDPRKTGVSGITGKMVSIRHANGSDRVIVGDYLRENHEDAGIEKAEVVVAAENERIIGFGVLKKENAAACLSLFEDSRRRGIGSSIVKHLLEFTSVQRVYSSRYVSYFTHTGAARLRTVRVARPWPRGKPCRVPLMERLAGPPYKRK